MKRPSAAWAVATALAVGCGAVLAQGGERPTVRPGGVIRLSPPAAPTASPGSSTIPSTVPATPGAAVPPPPAAGVETVAPAVGSYKDIDDYYDDRADDVADEVETDEYREADDGDGQDDGDRYPDREGEDPDRDDEDEDEDDDGDGDRG